MATLIKAILDYYTDSTSPQAVALQTALGAGRMFRGRADDKKNMPYCTLYEGVSSPEDYSKGYATRVDSCPVQFDVFSTSAATTEAIIEAIDNAYSGPNAAKLTITNRLHLCTYYNFHSTNADPEPNIWHGVIELDFHLQKTAT